MRILLLLTLLTTATHAATPKYKTLTCAQLTLLAAKQTTTAYFAHRELQDRIWNTRSPLAQRLEAVVALVEAGKQSSLFKPKLLSLTDCPPEPRAITYAAFLLSIPVHPFFVGNLTRGMYRALDIPEVSDLVFEPGTSKLNARGAVLAETLGAQIVRNRLFLYDSLLGVCEFNEDLDVTHRRRVFFDRVKEVVDSSSPIAVLFKTLLEGESLSDREVVRSRLEEAFADGPISLAPLFGAKDMKFPPMASSFILVGPELTFSLSVGLFGTSAEAELAFRFHSSTDWKSLHGWNFAIVNKSGKKIATFTTGTPLDAEGGNVTVFNSNRLSNHDQYHNYHHPLFLKWLPPKP